MYSDQLYLFSEATHFRSIFIALHIKTHNYARRDTDMATSLCLSVGQTLVLCYNDLTDTINAAY